MEMIYRSLERVVCLVSPVEGEKERERERKRRKKKLIPVTLPQKKWEGKITKRILMLRL